jgi:hypothetical protein
MGRTRPHDRQLRLGCWPRLIGLYAMQAFNWIAYYKCVLLVETTRVVYREPQSLWPHVALQVVNAAPVGDVGCDYGIVTR